MLLDILGFLGQRSGLVKGTKAGAVVPSQRSADTGDTGLTMSLSLELL